MVIALAWGAYLDTSTRPCKSSIIKAFNGAFKGYFLKAIKDKKPASVYELAKILHRDIKNVLQDIAYLQEMGLVDVTETRDKKIPHVRYDKNCRWQQVKALKAQGVSIKKIARKLKLSKNTVRKYLSMNVS